MRSIVLMLIDPAKTYQLVVGKALWLEAKSEVLALTGSSLMSLHTASVVLISSLKYYYLGHSSFTIKHLPTTPNTVPYHK